ncbi:hypothetical protein HMSP1_83 [Sinorhizobium phage HMSP1-Susan]|nr:hypothetical protein HMSP1_83 [Sinorhizobium phage HMSP1-Susan]
MRDKLAKALKDATAEFEAAKIKMRRAANVLKMHDVLNSGYHNKIVRTSTYPTGIHVTTDMMFNDDGTTHRIAGPIMKKDGTPGLRIGYIYLYHNTKMEIEDFPPQNPTRGVMLNAENDSLFTFEITHYVNEGDFAFYVRSAVPNDDLLGTFKDGTISLDDGTVWNEKYHWWRQYGA